MAETTMNGEPLSQQAAADRLNSLASALREGNELPVSVRNKDVTHKPSEMMNYRMEVTEKRSRFCESRGTVQMTLDWKP